MATPGDMVGHGLELLSLVVTLQLCSELLGWPTARIGAHTRAKQTRDADDGAQFQTAVICNLAGMVMPGCACPCVR
jgi:hypothetical protein